MIAYRIAVLFVAIVSYSSCYRIKADKGETERNLRATPAVDVAESTLVLTNVIFRHGNRTPELSELYPNDPYYNYTYYPLGNGQLTRVGKQKEYLVGQQLRERYDTFLGEYYIPDYLEARSTDYNRTKMSLELVLASLFIPKGEQIWADGFDWQPIPYTYLPKVEDLELRGIDCQRYKVSTEELNNSTEVQAEYSEYQEIFDYIAENSGLNVTKYEDVYDLYFGLSTEEEYGFELPEWLQTVWPDTITSIAIKQYGIYTRTTERKQMAAGYFLRKLIRDAESKISDPDNSKRMYLYSAHENNLGQILVTLDIFQTIEIPTYGSYIIFELHYINSTYGFKIYYQNHNPSEIRLLKLPACEQFCSLENLQNIIGEYIAVEDSLCGN